MKAQLLPPCSLVLFQGPAFKDLRKERKEKLGIKHLSLTRDT